MHLYVITYKGEPAELFQLSRVLSGHVREDPRFFSSSFYPTNMIIAYEEDCAKSLYVRKLKGSWQDRPAGIECEKFKLVKE